MDHATNHDTSNYKHLAAALAINAILMFFITYAMLSSIDHFYVNINRVYMALMMAAPMLIVMLAVMRAMYRNRRLNYALYAAAVAVFVLSLAFARTQTPVGNEQFLRSMIPHHSSAILMCQRAAITDPEIRTLCTQIVRSQRDEIAQMRRMLTRH